MGRKWPTSITSVAWLLDHGRAQNALLGAGDLDVEALFDDVDDLVDDQAHGAPSSANTRIGCEPVAWTVTPSICTSGISCSRYCTHVAAVRELDLVGGDLLEAGDEAKRDRLGLAGAGAEHQKRGQLLAADRVSRHRRPSHGPRSRPRRAPGDAVGVDDHDHPRRCPSRRGASRSHRRGRACRACALHIVDAGAAR